jgi:L-asparaginase
LSAKPRLSRLPKVLILFCGGTIVMAKTKAGILDMVDKDQAIHDLLTIEPRIHDLANISVEYVDNIDSSNITTEHWDTIARIIEKNYDTYDGFVITHGTNTMAYTSSALSFSLQNLGKPVVLTGSQIPGNLIETDARRNFVNAIRLATMDISGVMVVFDEEIMLGARASKVSESKLDAFETINWDDLGEIRLDIRLSDEHRPRHNRPLNLRAGFDNNIVVITLYPQMNPMTLKAALHEGVGGVILRGYGAGGISYAYLDILKDLKKRKIPVVISTQCMEGATLMHMDDVGTQALQTGVIQAYDMSIECTITKLMWALKHAQYEGIQGIMHRNYTGEINVEGKIY